MAIPTPRLALALLGLGLLIAVALTATAHFAPRGVGKLAGASCESPERGGEGYTIAAGRAGEIVGLTVRPGSAGRSRISVQVVGPDGAVAARDVRMRLSDGSEAQLRSTETPGCYAGRASLVGGSSLMILPSTPAGDLSVPLRLPENPRPAAALVRRARRATAGLYGVRERQLVRSALDRPQIPVSVVYSGRRLAVTTQGMPKPRVAEPLWRSFFFWMQRSGLRLPTRIGSTRRDGRQLALVAGYLPIPLWLELEVDPVTGRVYGQRMLTPGHFMTSTFDEFSE